MTTTTNLLFSSSLITSLVAAGATSVGHHGTIKKVFASVTGSKWAANRAALVVLRSRLAEEQARIAEDVLLAVAEQDEPTTDREPTVVAGKVEILCSVCSLPRFVKPQDVFQVTRCVDCQAEHVAERRRARRQARRAEAVLATIATEVA